ncbi:ABC transporter substrate-binding protein [Thermoactinospora rubra]|uniref:ABC transporter substrate-binding protein n=1 Tax=Thermoactinospora rubra TaxID=1088767 RepID=UPI000A11A7DE|nr:ABC transporter substrate-binding protein [Thermoactinospora rubra]
MHITGTWRRARLAAAAGACLIALTACGESVGGTSAGKTLVAANYGGVTGKALKQELEDPYTRATGTTFQQVNVGTGFAAKLQAQAQSQNVSWDVIEGLAGADAAQLHELGLLEPLPQDMKARLEKVSLPGTVTDYGVALAETGYVIACNTAKVSRCPADPAQFWDTAAFPGRRALPDNPAAMLATALVADGVKAQDVFPIDTERAFASMARIKPHVDVWTTSGDQQMQVMRDQQVDMSIMWNGRAKALMDQGVKLRLEWTGSLVNPNYMVVVKGGPNTPEAMRYLEWYATHPEAQAGLARQLAYGMSHVETARHLSQSEAALLPAAHADDNQVRLDPQWWVGNRKAVEQPWRELVGG